MAERREVPVGVKRVPVAQGVLSLPSQRLLAANRDAQIYEQGASHNVFRCSQ